VFCNESSDLEAIGLGWGIYYKLLFLRTQGNAPEENKAEQARHLCCRSYCSLTRPLLPSFSWASKAFFITMAIQGTRSLLYLNLKGSNFEICEDRLLWKHYATAKYNTDITQEGGASKIT
jgi:hypothetical protein